MTQPGQIDDGTAEPPAPTMSSPWLRILLISLIVLFSLAATVLATIQSRSADQAPTLPGHDENTGIELSDVVASTHGMDIQAPTGFDFVLEHWEPHRAAIRFHNHELGQRQQIFYYTNSEDFGDATEECGVELDGLEALLESVTERDDAVPIETGTTDQTAYCTITGVLDGEDYDYAFRIFAPPHGPVVAVQTRTDVGRTSELHENLETYFTCIAAEAADVELAAC